MTASKYVFKTARILEMLRGEAEKYLKESSVEDTLLNNPDISRDTLAARLVNRASVQASIVGAGTGAMGLPGIVLDAIPVTRIHIKLICDISKIYGKKKDFDFEDIDTVMKLFGMSLGIRGGVTLAERGSVKALSKTSARALAKKLGIQLTEEGVLRTVPVFSMLACGALNYIATQRLGTITLNYFQTGY